MGLLFFAELVGEREVDIPLISKNRLVGTNHDLKTKRVHLSCSGSHEPRLSEQREEVSQKIRAHICLHVEALGLITGNEWTSLEHFQERLYSTSRVSPRREF